MNGEVDKAGRALLSINLRVDDRSETKSLTTWIDTAFDGELVVPQKAIDALGLPQSAAVEATLADGTSVLLETFHCQVDWYGVSREVEVVANQGRLPLLGVGLLKEHKLTVDYVSGELMLE